jgi:predicted neuraminidase
MPRPFCDPWRPILILVLSLAGTAIFVDGDSNSVSARERRDSLIFPLQDQHVHSSSLIELPNGDLLTCWFHGSGERKSNDVVIQGSRLAADATAWSPVFLMADTPGLPDCNPVLFLDRRERLWLFWIVPIANRWEHSLLKFRRADQWETKGAPPWSWQGTILLQPGAQFAEQLAEGFALLQPEEGMWAEYAPPYTRLLLHAARDPAKRQRGWMTRTHPITLESGRILLPLYSDGFNVSLVAISDDNGASWRASRPIVGLGPIQPTIIPQNNGQLVALMRDSGDAPSRVLRSTSADGGESWTAAVDTKIPNPGSSLEAIRIGDGRWVMALNDTEQGRHRLTLACSDDEGTTWKWKRVLEEAPQRDRSFEYPSLIQTTDGRLHCTYSYVTRAGRAIRHTSVDVDWILAGGETENW